MFTLPDREEIRQMNKLELRAFAKDIRSFLVDKVSKKGGHLASNLGTVELSIALWRVFDFPKDKVIFDVGHQSYTYKLLSGRVEGFQSLREFGGMSGFPKTTESEYDCFDTGHSSTSLSAALGFALARDLKNEDYKVISVVGDGALTGGEAYEALNNAVNLKSGMIIILNDNQMSISRNVGGISRYLTSVRSSKGYNRMKAGVKNALSSSAYGEKVIRRLDNTKDSLKEIVLPTGMIFENLGLKYLGPVDGHDVLQMERVLRRAVSLNRPVVIHVLTKKGKGYGFAEEKPWLYHGVGAFDPSLGIQESKSKALSYSDVVSEFLLEQGADHPEICAVTAAMGDSVGFTGFKEKYPDRVFDVGIAEAHAMTFSAGLAAAGLHPYIALYSSFAQRAYDQVIHDVCMQKLPVTILLDRAGLVGKDGETHQGAFDLAFLSSIPNMTVWAPRNASEFRAMLRFSGDFKGPLAIRYPRGKADEGETTTITEENLLKAETIYGNGTSPKVIFLSTGTCANLSVDTAKALGDMGISAEVLHMRSVKPLDEEAVKDAFHRASLIVTLEDGVVFGGFGERISALFAGDASEKTTKAVLNKGIPDRFVPQGNVPELLEMLGLTKEKLSAEIKDYLKETNEIR